MPITHPNEQSTSPRRTRRYTWPEVLRAVAHVLSRPAGPRHQVEVEPTGPWGVDADLVVYAHREGRPLVLADVAVWLAVMDPVVSTRMTRTGAQVWVSVVGVIAAGPTVELRVPIRADDLPVEVGFGAHAITIDELVAMAAQDQPAGHLCTAAGVR